MKQIELAVAIRYEGELPKQGMTKIIEARVYDYLQAKGTTVSDVQALVTEFPKEVK